jgi:hypothetical protein
MQNRLLARITDLTKRIYRLEKADGLDWSITT